MNTTEFRKEIVKIMPGYKWTVAKPCQLKTDAARGFSHMTATGIQSAGFNRVSTLLIVRHEEDGTIEYEAKIAGYGSKMAELVAHAQMYDAIAISDDTVKYVASDAVSCSTGCINFCQRCCTFLCRAM